MQTESGWPGAEQRDAPLHVRSIAGDGEQRIGEEDDTDRRSDIKIGDCGPMTKVEGQSGAACNTGKDRSARALLDPTPLKRTLFYIVSDIVVVICASLLTYTVTTRSVWFSAGRITLHTALPGALAVAVCQVVLGFLSSSYKFKWSTFSLVDVPRIALPSVDRKSVV